MTILKFLYALILLYWSDALLVVIVVAALAFLYRRGKKDLVKDIIYKFIVQAEVALGGATGGAKYSLVIANLYDALPLMLRLLFPKTTLTKYIKELAEVLKTKLKEPGVNLLTYAQEVEANTLAK